MIVVVVPVLLSLNLDFLARISSIGVKGLIEIQLREIKEKQAEQQKTLDEYSAILANLLTDQEQFHLRILAQGDAEYTGRASLRAELHRLRKFRLIAEVYPQRINTIYDTIVVKIGSYVKITDMGRRFLAEMDRIARE
ncbi:MAG: hypothetical protein JWP89_5444 [Schlesneria sp.]|nr:hypothetical protein [Schlesneria sp.]